MIELSFRVIDRVTRTWSYDASERADEAIAELNARLHEHGIGYVFEGGEIIRVDSQLLHAEAVKPALILASASPQRRRLLKKLKMSFRIVASRVSEKSREKAPRRLVVELARRKARRG